MFIAKKLLKRKVYVYRNDVYIKTRAKGQPDSSGLGWRLPNWKAQCDMSTPGKAGGDICSLPLSGAPPHEGRRVTVRVSPPSRYTAAIGPEHCSSLMTQALLSMLSLAAVVPGSLFWVTVKHCFMTQSLVPWKTYTRCGKFRSSSPSAACQCSHPLSY